MDIDRRSLLKAGLGLGMACLWPPQQLLAQVQPLLRKKIPSSGETIPIIGIGTAPRSAIRAFKVESARAALIS